MVLCPTKSKKDRTKSENNQNQASEQTDGKTDRQTNRSTDGRTHRQTDESDVVYDTNTALAILFHHYK